MFTEPLHDISNHIKNIYQELPWHFEKESKKEIKEIVHGSFQGKEARNAADYRRSLLKVTQYLLLNFPEHFMTTILITMCEIQEIIYSPENNKNLQKILRLYTVTFKHAQEIKKHLRNNIKSLTSRKFFGSYYHSIIHHSPMQYRLFSGRTSNTEKKKLHSTLSKHSLILHQIIMTQMSF